MSTSSDAKPLNDDALVAQLERLTDVERARLSDTFATLMNDQRLRIEYATSRANALATVAGVLLAAGVGGLIAITKDEWDYFPARLGVFVLVIGFMLTGAVVLWVWGRQVNWNYPFKAVSQTWKHFYRDALPGMGKPGVRWHARISRDFKAVKELQYTQGRAGFIERALSLRDPSISLAQDLEQAYLLHWTDLYKNQFLTQLRRVFAHGVITTLLAALAAFVIAALVAGDLYDSETTTPSRAAGGATTATEVATPSEK